MLRTRVLTAAVGIPLFVALVVLGDLYLFAAAAVLAIIGIREFYGLAALRELDPFEELGYAAGGMILLGFWAGQGVGVTIGLTLLLVGTLARQVWTRGTYTLESSAVTVFGPLYVAVLLGHILLLRNLSHEPIPAPVVEWIEAGAGYVLLVFAITWATDTAAYFVGSAVGGPKLLPELSPGKTQSGAVAGLAGGVLAGVLVGTWVGLPALHGAALGLLAGAAAQAGDLAESAIKRWAGVKDSGAVFPGHGGVLDRFDSALFVLPVVYYYLKAVTLL